MSEQEFSAFLYDIIHLSLPLLGPGDDAATLKAYDIAISNISGGCGYHFLDKYADRIVIQKSIG